MDIQKRYTLPFPVTQVYSAWTSSNTVIAPAERMHIDPVVGGVYQLFMPGASGTPSNEGRFLAITPNKHLRYTWEWNKDGEVTEIDVAFTPAGQGCDIVLNHTGFKNADSAAMHDSGWDSYIDGFTRFLAGR